LTIVPSLANNAVQTYLQDLTTALESPVVFGDEVYIIAAINSDIKVPETETYGISHAAALAGYADVFQLIADRLVETPVPATYIEPHLRFINSLQNYRQTITALSRSETDPLLALAVLPMYFDRKVVFNTSVENLLNQLRIDGVDISPLTD
jgi:hypothetical protein